MESTTAAEWIREVSADIEQATTDFLDRKLQWSREHSEAAFVLADAVRSFTLRPGKRIRPLLVVAGFRAIKEDGDLGAIISASVAAELLQTYLLIHDDWMDQDDLRRGKPSMHVQMTERYGDPHVGASISVLIGNLACAYAWEVLSLSPIGSEMVCSTVRAFWEMQQVVAIGQLLDVVSSDNVAEVRRLKTGSYTVSGPLQIGAILGSASEEQHRALREYGLQLGETFQIRDDILGLYGDSKSTGKPIGNDIRMGKRTALVTEAMEVLVGEQRKRFDQVFNRRDATEEDIASIRVLFEEAGVLARVEQQVKKHFDQSLAALASAPLKRLGVEVLQSLAMLAAYRKS